MSKKKILILDDQKNWREVISGLLSDEGYEVRAVANVAKAWNLLTTSKFDIAIIDVRLEDKNPFDIQGIELLEMLIDHQIESLPIIIMTGYSFKGLEEIVKSKFGVQYFLKKGTKDFQYLEKFNNLIASVIDENKHQNH